MLAGHYAAANLSPALFTDDPVTAMSTLIKAIHVNQLRNNLDAARAAIGMPAISYTDTVSATITPVKALHFTQLRQGTQ